MKKVEFTYQPSEIGTWYLYADMEGVTYSAKCTNQKLMNMIKSQDEDTALEAKKQAAELVLSKYGLMGSVIAEQDRKGTTLYYTEEP